MNRRQLAKNLAVSLSRADWTKDTLKAALKRRLPPPLRGLADKMSEALVRDIASPYAPAPKIIQTILDQNADFERLFKLCQKNDTWPDPDLAPSVMAPVHAFAELDLPQLTTVEALADWTGLSLDQLTYLADVQNRFEEHGDTAVNHYHYMLKPKSLGGLRVIEAPKKRLKAVQRHILTAILNKIPTHPNAFGFVQGRNCLNGASRHAGEQVVVCFDLKDFFPSVRYARVFGLFRCLGYPHAVARHLSALCTNVTPSRIIAKLRPEDRPLYKAAHLPQGAPTSPSLANQTIFTLDRRISALARSLNANYSRYADDLAFSGDKHIAGVLLRAIPNIVQEEGFAINPGKTRISSATSRQTVTGLVVNQHLNIDRRTFDTLKATIHACGKPDDTRLADPVFRSSLIGKLDWVERVNPGRGRKLKMLLLKALSQPPS